MNALLLFLACAGVVAVCAWLAYGKGAQRGHHLAAEMRSLREQVALHRRRKEEAIRDLNVLAAFMANVLQAEGIAAARGLPDSPEAWRIYRGYDAHFRGWENCLYIEPPARYGVGQLCWHFPTEQAWLIDVIGPDEHPTGWDKRTRDERRDAIEAFLAGIS